MAVLGSEKAYDYLIQDYKVAEQWPEYLERFYEVKEKFSELSEETWQSNMLRLALDTQGASDLLWRGISILHDQ